MEMKKSLVKLQCLAALTLFVGAPIANSVSSVYAETTAQSQTDANSFSAKLNSKAEQSGRLLIRNSAKELSITKVELLDKDSKSLKTIYDSAKESKDVTKSGEDLLVNFDAPKAEGMSVKVSYDRSKLGDKEAIATVAVLLKDGAGTSAAKQFNAKNESKDQIDKSTDAALAKLQELKKAEDAKNAETKPSDTTKPSSDTKPSTETKPSVSKETKTSDTTKPSKEVKPSTETKPSADTTKTSSETKPSTQNDNANSKVNNPFAEIVKEKASFDNIQLDRAKSIADQFVQSYEKAVNSAKSETLPKTEKDLADKSILDLKKEAANEKATSASIGQAYNTAYNAVKALSDKIDQKSAETKPSTSQSSDSKDKGKTPSKYADTNEKSSVGKIVIGSVMLAITAAAGFFGYKKFKESNENESSKN